ncbi:MAG: DUF5723 family protein [Bacteroidota bacterium]
MPFITFKAQESIGIISDNYTPVFSMRMNPASIADQKPWMSLQLVGVSAYARNNLVFAENTKLQNLSSESTYGFDTNNRSYSLYSQAELAGPSLSFTYQKHAFGIHTAARVYGSAFNLPGEIGEYINNTDGFELEPGIYEIRNLKAKGLGWVEVGINYGQVYRQGNNNQYSWGASINRLFGVGSAGLSINEATLEIRDTLDFGLFANADANYFFNEPAFNSGRGWSTNVGFVYKKMKSDVSNHIPHSPKGACMITDYRLKIGASLLDFGSLKFDSNAESAQLEAEFNSDDLEEIYDGEISDQIILNQASTYSIATPAALSLQLDYALTDKIYAAATLVQNIEFLQKNGVKRANVLGTSIRYESRWLGVSIPVTVYNYTRPQLGIALRAGIFVIGSDHVIPFILNSNIYASNAYFRVHIPILRNPSCVQKNQKSKRKKNTDSYPPCPKW